MHRSITRKLLVVTLLPCATVVLLTTGTLLVYELVSFRDTMVNNLTTLARVVGNNSTAALAFDNREDATDVLGALSAEPNVLRAVLYDRDGQQFAAYPSNADTRDIPAPPLEGGSRFSQTDLVVVEPVADGPRRLGTVYLQSDLGALFARLRLYAAVMLGAVLASFIAAIALSSRLRGHISQPVLTLAGVARQVTERNDYSVRATRQSEDELGALTDAFNAMLARVEEQNRELRAQSAHLREEVEARTQAEQDVRALNAALEKRVEERTRDLAAANKELEAFSYSVSHDLRAPLRHVLGFVELLQRDVASIANDRSRHYMQTIAKAAADMGQLIDDLLQFSRTSRSEVRRAPVALGPLVEAVRNNLVRETQGRDIEWTVEALPEVVGDPALLKQVFANLLDNAVKYTRQRQQAHIAIGCLQTEADHAVLFVRDDGAGFDMKYAQKLFGVFQRLHRPEEFEGTGIGLATVQRIIARHGGRIWADSAVDQGTTFFFTLPLVDSSSRTPTERLDDIIEANPAR